MKYSPSNFINILFFNCRLIQKKSYLLILPCCIISLLLSTHAGAQSYAQPDAGKIKLKLNKLNVLGSVLYVAAHPDDENTRLITSLGNDDLYSVAYLSMTRGDGGQNLIGNELRDRLGVIRTQELLSARRIDGGEQFFTRANDFGFSKSAEETMRIWGKEEILSDVVKIYRQFQPDIIIRRFPPDERAGHGHHTSSAILAQEAFDLSADKNVYPEQVKKYGTWHAARFFTNTGRWWNTAINEKTPGITAVNVGGYSTLLGESFTEIAAISRSQHKSQGFGSRGTRGDQNEFLEFVKGQAAGSKPFDGMNTSWARLKGGDKIQPLVDNAISTYNPEKPYELVPALLQIKKAISTLEPGVWKTRKLVETDQLIIDCLGLFIDISPDHYWGSPGHKVNIQFEVVNRSAVEVTLERIVSHGVEFDSTAQAVLKNNIPLAFKTQKIVTKKSTYSDPFWLQQQHDIGRFTVTNPELIGKPANDPAVTFSFELKIGNEKLTINRPLAFRWTDPVKGELKRPFEIVPPVFVNISDKVLIFSDSKPKEIKVVLKSAVKDTVKGTLNLKLPTGWKAIPAEMPFELVTIDQEQFKIFQVHPSAKEVTDKLRVEAHISDGNNYSYSLETIEYDHIPVQTLLPAAEAKVVRIDLKKVSNNIAYIKGAGDEIPASLRNMGYTVWEMKDDEVTLENLRKMDAVVLGIRAVNTNERLDFMMNDLLEYVRSGGTMVVQYNTNFDFETTRYSPYKLSLSRDRVTEEDAEVRMLKPNHPILNTPNKITPADFTGWVQERGLYFPNSWGDEFEAVLSMNDKGENARDGSLLVAQYGEGFYIYTALSFFRELPEGVSGAYKLFANIVSMKNDKREAK